MLAEQRSPADRVLASRLLTAGVSPQIALKSPIGSILKVPYFKLFFWLY
jgi:hypothetical protein